MYNCKDKKITIAGEAKNILELSISTKCCEGKTKKYYKNPTGSIALSINNITPIYDSGCPDPPGTGCNTCHLQTTWNFRVNIDVSSFSSASGTVNEYSNSSLTNLIDSNPITLSWFNAPRSFQVSSQDVYIVVNAVFVTPDGETFTLQTGMSSTEQMCPNDYFNYLPTVTSTTMSTFIVEGSNIIIPIDLSNGFYTVSGDLNSCFLVDCGQKLECKVADKITSLVKSNCYECNNKKDLEKAMEIYMLFELFKSNCEDCCSKCYIYNMLTDLLEECTNC